MDTITKAQGLIQFRVLIDTTIKVYSINSYLQIHQSKQTEPPYKFTLNKMGCLVHQFELVNISNPMFGSPT